MRRASALRNTVFTMAGQLLARLLALVLYAVFARAVGPERYGDFAFGLAFGTLGVALLEPGLNPLLVRDGARSAELLRLRLAEALGYKLVALLLVWPSLIAIAALSGYRGPPLVAVALGGGMILLGALEDLAASALTAVERLDLEGTLRALSKLFAAALGLTAIFASGSFELILGALLLASLATAGCGLALVRRAGVPLGVGFDLRALRGQIAQMWPLTASGIMWLLVLRLDQILASAMGVPHAALGNYGAAAKIVEALVLFPGAIATAFQPRLSRAWSESSGAASRQLRLALTASLALSVPIAVGGALLAPGLSSLVYGERFAGTPPLLALQLLCLPLIGIQFLSNHALVAAGATRPLALAVGTNLAVNVACNLALIPRLGVLGASVSALTGATAATVAYALALGRAGARPGLWRASWRPALSAAAMGVAVALLRDRVPLVACIGAGAVVYGGAMLILGGLASLQELRGPAPAPAAPETAGAVEPP